MSIGGVNGAMGVDRVMALRAQILERNQALKAAAQTGGAQAAEGAAAAASAQPASFADTLNEAVKSVNDSQQQAAKLSESYERGETMDIAKVMLARQQASVGFEATLQVRNKLLSAYKDIMSMPV
ncbi:flagellar hook-basal body complex protein FliE [Sphingomonas carotinifaciens]|uniref:Flagellar hook-basal body complex protein FliE n=1 Tax=Sphingomonas carotinifaciens TaxID=1166323 RepID=A0A1G7GMT1_9SPHN|nr:MULTISPECIES: flagellar hook-basal body complex protein FliE [Sphingomonas]MBB4086590.1 flagellar hook-basal body complex protein FliE [Sphingomonas carotinifaciens]MWC42941.1 flagellar hook-basal body complex protein FliE [Sphingomonas carotinifaciens]SDE89299.1 flagellar hook-basal body complex protein FliE [Sphingomonas carotinifaciens]